MRSQLQAFLDLLVERFETEEYIDDDPIAIPHAFEDPRDQEVIGLFAALLAWGQRKTILAKLAELSDRMGNRPYEFVRDFRATRDADRLSGFKHRTFNEDDATWLIANLSARLETAGSIEKMFAFNQDDTDIANGIEFFAASVLDRDENTPSRLRKHVARPSTGSACKRLCMYVRWMTRPGPFDLGIWKSVRPSQLVAPVDVHAGRQARILGLLARKPNDWRAALELTASCRRLSPDDPVRYDLALFGIGANKIRIPDELISAPAAQRS